MKFKKIKVGEIHITNGYGYVEIIEQTQCNDCTIRFLEDGTILQNKKYGSIKRGQVRNPYKRIYYGEGYMGIGEYDSKNSPEAYKKWQNMMQRSYSIEYHKIYPSYKNVEVCEEWKCFQNFAEWFYGNYKSYMLKWTLDKDILSNTKTYSPETCVLVPQVINLMVSKMYKPICVPKIKERYYPNMMINGVRISLEICNTYKEAVDLGIEKRKEYIFNTLIEYKEFLDRKIIDCILLMTTTIREKIGYPSL